ncbi:inactive LRR receptor-like serine/threonine-protein kinase BIR2 [Tanacetum coccineum]
MCSIKKKFCASLSYRSIWNEKKSSKKKKREERNKSSKYEAKFWHMESSLCCSPLSLSRFASLRFLSRIALSAAKGLAWLHHGYRLAILLQNVSSDAIFFDENYNARLIDFGLARFFTSPTDQLNEISYANGCVGEFGYVAPKYSSALVASTKGDTYGFGVVLITGQKPLNVMMIKLFKFFILQVTVAPQPRARWSMYRVSEALMRGE